MENPWTDYYDNTEAFHAILEKMTPLGFEDGTSNNDECPCIIKDPGEDDEICIWVDYKSPELRDEGRQEFGVKYDNLCIDYDTIPEVETRVAELLEFVKNKPRSITP